MSIESIRAAARTRVLTASEISQLRGADPYGRLSSQVKNQQMQLARAVAISSPNKGGASATPVNLFPTSQFSLGGALGGIADFFTGGGATAVAGGIGNVIGSLSGGATTFVPTNGASDFDPIACVIPGQRVDPVTGECRFFVGEQSGPDTGGRAVVGGFGLPALAPAIVGEIRGKPVRRCNRGSVLGTDNLCYSKAVLPPRSKFRKWKRPIPPVLSRSDSKAIKRAASVKDKVGDLARDAGLYVANSKPKPRARAPQHTHTVSHNGSN